MQQLSKAYQWLLKEGGPKMIVEALKEFGTVETPGQGNNPKIIAWGKEAGEDVAKVYKADEIPWCGLFMSVMAKRAGKKVPKDPLWALNWGTFGVPAECAKLGDVLTFIRKTSTGAKAGHVALYVGEDATAYHILGGNQSDAVNITRIDKKRLYAIRRPDYNIEPPNVRTVILKATGGLSADEQ